MTERSDGSFPVLGVIFDILAVPFSLLSGFITGLVAPIAAIAAMVAGIRLLTGKVPFLGQAWEDEEGARHLSFRLVPPEQVGELFAEQKEEIGGEIAKMQAELKVIIEEARAAAPTTASE
jgi:hypothetical protein